MRPHPQSRDVLLRRLQRLAPQVLFGTLSETYRTCGRPGCHCQQGAKHGPHLYVSFRGSEGRTQGYYVPHALGAAVRAGAAAWQELQGLLRRNPSSCWDWRRLDDVQAVYGERRHPARGHRSYLSRLKRGASPRPHSR